ncbi:GNAT family N-acetyltransferase [Candidatus Enterococcus willemsii]
MMIDYLSTLTPNELDEIATIWLGTNLQAHDFIAPTYWHQMYPEVKEQLTQATFFVYRKEKILGFIGLIDTYIAGIFVEPSTQQKGIGKKLLTAAKQHATTLSLTVYQKNSTAYHFYRSQGFTVTKTTTDETGEIAFEMIWQK